MEKLKCNSRRTTSFTMAGISRRSSTSHRRTLTCSPSFHFARTQTRRPESSISLPERMSSIRKTEIRSTEQPFPQRPKMHSRAKSVPCLPSSGQISNHGFPRKELLNYNTITLQDSKEDLHVKSVVLRNFKMEKSEVSKNEEEFYESIVRSQSCSETEKERQHRALSRHKESLRISSAKLNDLRRPGYKRLNCPRLLRFEEPAQMPKQFCDVLGTKACKDCARLGERLSNVNDYDSVFPDISVSTFQLCTKADETSIKTSPKNQQSCDAWERYRTNSCPAHRRYKHGTRPAPSRASSPISRADSLKFRLDEDTIAEISDSDEHELKGDTADDSDHDSDLESEVDIPISPEPSTSTNRKNSDYFCRKYKQYSSRGGTPESLRSMTPVHAGIEADKRRIMEYVWRLLAPKPPQMDVKNMNVSVYTPKAIPGIKIIEDGQQSTIIVQRPPEVRDHMW